MVAINIETGAAKNGAMSIHLSRNWGWLLLRGILALTLGALTLLMPILALRSLILLFSAYMLADGIIGIVSAVRAARAHERWGWLVFEGVLNILAGSAAFFLPAIAVLTFVLLASAWAIVSGLALVVAAFRLHKTYGRWFMGLGGLVSIVWGALLFVAPVAGAFVMTIWIGAYALAFGVVMIFLSIRLRSRHGSVGSSTEKAPVPGITDPTRPHPAS